MVTFEEFTLENGLRVIVHEDHHVQIAVMNILYRVGARNESPDRTGFAHLFEHLMFGGSANVPSYDEPLQQAGGENNAFTSNDLTNYYLTVPAANLETGFWLESDRMMALSFDPRVLSVQQKVVVEEFKQSYLNRPYGDVWLKFRPMAYHVHPYQWATIGKEPSHIEQATMEDVRNFFYSHYLPNNAILVVAGHVHVDQVRRLAEKWFGPLSSGRVAEPAWSLEPEQTAKRILKVTADVPSHALYKGYHMPGRLDPTYHALDLATEMLSRGNSSRLYRHLVREKEIFTGISSFITASVDPGLLMFTGRVAGDIKPEEAEKHLDEVVSRFVDEGPTDEEMAKVRNQAETSQGFGEVEVMNRAYSLAYAAMLGDPGRVNTEIDIIQRVSSEDVRRAVRGVIREENSNVLHYHRDKAVTEENQMS